MRFEITSEMQHAYQFARDHYRNGYTYRDTLADALRDAVAAWLELQHSLTEHNKVVRLENGGVQAGFFKCDLCGVDLKAEAHRRLMGA